MGHVPALLGPVLTRLLTILATIVLLLHMPTVSFFAGVAAKEDSADVSGLREELLHAGVGLLVLLVIRVLNLYKPQGMTPYGWRKQREQRTVSRQ